MSTAYPASSSPCFIMPARSFSSSTRSILICRSLPDIRFGEVLPPVYHGRKQARSVLHLMYHKAQKMDRYVEVQERLAELVHLFEGLGSLLSEASGEEHAREDLELSP